MHEWLSTNVQVHKQWRRVGVHAQSELITKTCDDDADFCTKTETDDVPLAVMGFQGRLVVGVGKSLRIYDIGKKKLLRKVENKVLPI